ncbi:MAG: hypothetical protein HZB26_26500 [Candidatus Hydrogenedentes bacterium]|nr:hypothetical protein [Candidatus Hydrogenedentota bacterium]
MTQRLNYSCRDLAYAAVGLFGVLTLAGCPQPPNSGWTYSLGDSWSYAIGVEQMSDGGFVLGGTLVGGEYDNPVGMTLTRTDAHGALVWTKSYPGDGYAKANAMQRTSDGGFVLAGWSGDVLKTDVDGVVEWSKRINSKADLHAVRQTADGGYIFAGNISSEGLFQGWSGAYAAKTDAQGTVVWEETFIDSGGLGWGDTVAYAVVEISGGGFLLCGDINDGGYSETGQLMFLVRIGANGDLVWDKTLGRWGEAAYAAVEKDDGTFLIAGAGSKSRRLRDSEELYVICVDSNGNLIWQTYGDQAEVSAIVLLPDGSFAVSGGGSYLARFDTQGTELWTREYHNDAGIPRRLLPFPGGGNEALISTANGGFALAGFVWTDNDIMSLDFHRRGYLVVTDSAGNPVD